MTHAALPSTGSGCAPDLVGTAAPRELRPYQVEAVAAVLADWTAGRRRVGVVLPTATGKSSIIGALASHCYRLGMQVVLLAHREELCRQMVRDLLAVDPGIPVHHVGFVIANANDHHAPIVAATFQSLRSARRLQALGKRHVILVDETHHLAAEGFHTTFSDLGGYDDALMAGFTATMRRADKGSVGLGDVITKISFERDLPWAIAEGYVVPPRGLTVALDDLNVLNDVRTVAGDFAQNELAEVMEAATSYVVDAITLHAASRRPIIFAASIDAAHLIADALNEVNYPAVAVTGEMNYTDRKPLYDQYRSGAVRAMVTVMVLTEGADFPMCDCVVLARPTRSVNLYSQMIGRSLRLYEDPWTGRVKDNALVLDLVGSARHMRLVNLTQLLPGADICTVDEDGNAIPEPEIELAPAAETPKTKVKRRGAVDMVSIDLMTGGTREVLWLDTLKGLPFIPLTDHWIVSLWPAGGTVQGAQLWAVGNKNTHTGAGGWMGGQATYLPLKEAVEYAETCVEAAGFRLPKRNAGWHASGAAPSEPQQQLARSLGIVDYDICTKGRLSDEISIVFASRSLDRHVQQVAS